MASQLDILAKAAVAGCQLVDVELQTAVRSKPSQISALRSHASLILSFQAFDVVRVMTQGGPVKSTTIFVYAIYEQIFLALSVGKASALTIVFFAVLLRLPPLFLLQAPRSPPRRLPRMTRRS